MSEIAKLGAWQVAFWWATFTIGGAAMWVTFGGQHRRQTADRQLAWLLWHWFTGGTLEGTRTVPLLDGNETDPVPRHTRAVRRGTLAAARTAVAVAAGAVWYVHAGARHGTDPGTVVGMGGMTAGVFAAATLAVVHAACEAAHYLCWVRPLHLAVYSHLGWDPDKRPSKYITVRRDRSEVTVGFPGDYTLKESHKADVNNAVRSVVDIGEYTDRWNPVGRHSYVLYRPKDYMPEGCYYHDKDTKALVAAAKRSAPLVGVKRGGKPVTVDLDSESPHVLISAGSGGGKSELVKSLVAQLMAGGALVMMIDFKRHSHPFLNGMPEDRVRYARDIGDIHHLLIQVARECEQRNRACDGKGIDDPLPTFPRLILVCEEMTVTMSKLRRWWKNRPPEERSPGDPPTSPAVEALEDIACVGRQVRIHIIAVAQMATAKSIGGSEIRENFAYRIMGRYTKRAWEMLVPECEFTPASRKPGRMQVCVGGDATEVHALLMTDKEARELALGGATVPQRDSTPISQGEHPVTATAGPPDEIDAPVPAVELVSLRQAVETGLLVITLTNLRSYRARDPRFPRRVVREGGTDLYDREQLAYWARNRDREIETTRV